MCFFDPRSMDRRQFLGAGVAVGAIASALDVGKSLVLPGLAEGAEPTPRGMDRVPAV